MYTATTKFLNQTRKNYNYKYNDIRNIWTYIGDFLYVVDGCYGLLNMA